MVVIEVAHLGRCRVDVGRHPLGEALAEAMTAAEAPVDTEAEAVEEGIREDEEHILEEEVDSTPEAEWETKAADTHLEEAEVAEEEEAKHACISFEAPATKEMHAVGITPRLKKWPINHKEIQEGLRPRLGQCQGKVNLRSRASTSSEVHAEKEMLAHITTRSPRKKQRLWRLGCKAEDQCLRIRHSMLALSRTATLDTCCSPEDLVAPWGGRTRRWDRASTSRTLAKTRGFRCKIKILTEGIKRSSAGLAQDATDRIRVLFCTMILVAMLDRTLDREGVAANQTLVPPEVSFSSLSRSKMSSVTWP